MIKQISIFIENKEGRVQNAIKILAKEGINIKALSVADTAKYGILRLIVSDNVKAASCLEESGFVVRENEVIAITVPDEPNGLNSVLELYEDYDINLEYLYAFSSTKLNKAIVVMRMENMDKAIEILEEHNIEMLNKEDIEEI